jgi:hypothetical protein
LEEWEVIGVITADVLIEKLHNADSWTRILVGAGKLHFLHGSAPGTIVVKNRSMVQLFQGTPEDVENYLKGKTEPTIQTVLTKRRSKKAKQPSTVVRQVPESRGEGSGRGTKYRASIFDLPVTKVVRWMGKDGFTVEQCMKACEAMLEIPPQITTIKIQRGWGATGKEPAPVLTEDQAAELRKFKV